MVIMVSLQSGGDSGLEGIDCHEIAFYYLMKPRGSMELKSGGYTSGGVRETMHRIKTDEIDEYKTFPTFLKEFLLSGRSGIEHIVTDERT